MAAAGASPFLSSWGALGKVPGALDGPENVSVDLRGEVYVADRDNNRIQKFSSTGALLGVLGRNGGDGSAGKNDGEFNRPRGVATDGLGDVYVADTGNNRIERFSPDARFLAKWGRNGGDGSAGLGPGEFNDPRGVATDGAGNVYVADHGNNRVQKFSPDGHFIAKWGRNGGDGSAGTGNGEFHLPRGLAVDRAGDVFVADKSNNRIQEFTSDGHFTRRWGRNGGDGSPGTGNGEFRIPYSIAVDPSGRVYVADTGNNRIQAFTPAGMFVARWGHNGGDGSPGTGAGEFKGPYGVGVDCRGNVYVSDEGNNRIEKFGDPASPPPACPPAVTLGQLPRRLRGRTLHLTAACDVPCQATVTASIWTRGHLVARLRGTKRELMPGGQVMLSLGFTGKARRRLRRSLASGAHPVLKLHALASGFGGQAPLVHSRSHLHR
jgi:DNA-binding beta-propeller fold protein YncE